MVLYRLRRVKGFGVLFILLLNLLVFSYNQSALGNLVNLVIQTNPQDETDDSSGLVAPQPWLLTLITATLSEFIPKLLYPLAGWLADAKLGRHKVMLYSLWVMWIGSLLLILSSILNYTLWMTKEEEKNVSYTLPISIVIYVVNIIGIAGYHVNAIPFGIDQMEGASGEEIASFIHWYYWTRNFNFGVIAMFATGSGLSCRKDTRKDNYHKEYNMYLLLFQSAFLTAALSLLLLFSSKLYKDPKIHNPIKKVKDISVFVLKHRQPVGIRRAHTYTYDAPPVRSDFAKQSYGGPFEDDDVEDVMSFWRIILFLLVSQIGAFLIITGYYNYPSFFEHMAPPNNAASSISHCSMEYLITSESVSVIFFVVSIPLYEFLIYPFIRNRIPRTKVRIGLGICVVLLGMSLLLAMDISGHAVASGKTACMFYDIVASDYKKIRIHPLYLIPVIAIMAFGEMLVFISTFEFIVAQSPYGMRGLIFGLWFMMYGITVGFLSMVLAVFSLGFRSSKNIGMQPSCGTVYITTVVALGCGGTLLYFVAVWLYKERQRGGQVDVNHQTILEGYYESGRESSNSFVGPKIHQISHRLNHDVTYIH